MKKILFFITILVINLNLNAQDIIGKVLEINSDGSINPIFGANVYWEETTVGTTTDTNGNYTINEATSFPASLSVSYVGYTYDSKEFINNEFIFYLKRSVELDEVNIISSVNSTKYSVVNSLNVQTLTVNELQKAACCNLSESFSTNASVDVSYSDAISGAKKIRMLGLDGRYVQITNESIPLIRGLSSSYGLNYVPGTWIESIQIIKGSGSVVNGFESFTGQINLEYFKPSTADKMYWNVYANSSQKFENNLALKKIYEKWSSNLFTHFSYHNKEIDENNDGFMDMPHLKNFNVLNRFLYEGSNVFRAQLFVKAMYEDREGGQLSNFLNPYKIDIHNDIIEIGTKTGILPDEDQRSIGLQTSFRRHNQEAKFGDKLYTGLQESVYLNLIRDVKINNNTFRYGLNYNADRFKESFNDSLFNKIDLITGVFSEYNLKIDDYFILVAGFRADYHNNSQYHYTPRVNVKYNPTDDLALRISAGKAFRISNIFVEHSNFLASNRIVKVRENLLPEVAWNMGFNLTYCFRLFGKEGIINADAYRTEFENQIVVDIESPGFLNFYNLNGKSFANTLQIDLGYELVERLNIKLAYKINVVKIEYENRGLLQPPLTPRDRALVNLSYANTTEDWEFDFTTNFVGKSRLPAHQDVKDAFSNPFFVHNSQITKRYDYIEVYIGAENILNFTQDNPIKIADNPTDENFDASIVYAPINGRMIYLGLRYKIN
ncbi:MAG: TonB-dependent receptor [Flavobacteriales bacterium]|nr:TonB-dependent receptor [Flavobacteriales bacterium]